MSDEPTLDLGIEGITNAQHIGSGGAADVYRAEQPRLGRSVAVKILRANTSPDNRARFEREAQTLGRLSNHPGIVTLHEAGLTAIGQPFLMMEYCPAGTLADRTNAEGPLAWQEACHVVSEIAEVVDDAHKSGVLHRDLKPANVLVDSRGKHLVADFGVAALSDTGNYSAAADFTPGYAPPETLRGEAATPAGDVYSLAATVHALITGRVPFEATNTSNNNVLAWIRRIEDEPPEDLRPLGVPDDVVTIIERAMSKDPSQRPGAAELSQQLGSAAEGVVFDLSPEAVPTDSRTTAVASVLPRKPTGNQPPMPGAAPPMPDVPTGTGVPTGNVPPMPVGDATGPVAGHAGVGEQPDVSGQTTAVPQLLPQKPTSMELPASDSAAPPMPPVTGGPLGVPTGGHPPVPGTPATGPVPPSPSDPATGPVAQAFTAPVAPETPAPPATPVVPTADLAAPPDFATPPESATPPDFATPPVATPAPTTSPVTDFQPAQEPLTAPVPPANPAAVPAPGAPVQPEQLTPLDQSAQPATTAVPAVLPTGPSTIDRPVIVDEDNEGSKKGLLIGLGVGAIVLIGGGVALFSTLTGGETAASTSTTAEVTTTLEQTTTTTEATTTSASTTTTVATRFGDAAGVVGPGSIVLSGQVPDEETAENLRAAAGEFYSRDQITDELEIDDSVDEVTLTLTGNLADEDKLAEVVEAFDALDNVTVEDELEFVTTTTAPPATQPPATRRTTTTRRRTTPAPTPAPTQPPAPVETGNTNPGLG